MYLLYKYEMLTFLSRVITWLYFVAAFPTPRFCIPSYLSISPILSIGKPLIKKKKN